MCPSLVCLYNTFDKCLKFRKVIISKLAIKNFRNPHKFTYKMCLLYLEDMVTLTSLLNSTMKLTFTLSTGLVELTMFLKS